MLGVFWTFRGVMVVLAQANCPGKRDLPSMSKRQIVHFNPSLSSSITTLTISHR
jgi:hypothetical protein